MFSNMRFKQFLPSLGEEGFTLTELMVSTFLGAIILGMAAGSATLNRRVFVDDVVRVRVMQNTRGAMDIIGTDLRIGGENLPSGFPAFLIEDGGAGPDTLTVRRNLKEEVLKVCSPLTAGSADRYVYFADSSTTSGCIYGDNEFAYNEWHEHRVAQGGTIKAYVFNTSTKIGEFFNVSADEDTGTTLAILKSESDPPWANSYDTTGSNVYILEEWRYEVSDNLLQVIQDGDELNPLNVMFGVDDFQVNVILTDNTLTNTFAATDSWSQIRLIEISLTGSEEAVGKAISRTVTSRFLPRNILSF